MRTSFSGINVEGPGRAGAFVLYHLQKGFVSMMNSSFQRKDLYA